jgi:BON domain
MVPSGEGIRRMTKVHRQKGEQIMFKLDRITKFLACLVLVISFMGCASTRTHEGTGEYVDDSAITTKVKGAIFTDPALKVLQINVETFKGVVQLSGFVDSAANVEKAGEVARSVKGVVSVKNDLVVK